MGGYGRTFEGETAARKKAAEDDFWAVPTSPATHSPQQRGQCDADDVAFYLSCRRRKDGKGTRRTRAENPARASSAAATTTRSTAATAPLDDGAVLKTAPHFTSVDDTDIIDEYAARKRAAMAAILAERAEGSLSRASR